MGREDQAFKLRMLEERGHWYRVIFLGAPKELVRKVQKAIKEQDEECKDACGRRDSAIHKRVRTKRRPLTEGVVCPYIVYWNTLSIGTLNTLSFLAMVKPRTSVPQVLGTQNPRQCEPQDRSNPRCSDF